MPDTEPNSESKEIESLLDEKLHTLEKEDIENGPFESKHEEDKNIAVENEVNTNFDTTNFVNNFQIIIQRKQKMNKPLIVFRVTQFLWFAAGVLPSIFLGVFLKQRGLSLVEISLAFSLIFIFQFITSFIAGTITDKLGNAKPMLTLMMIIAFSILTLLLLTPNVGNSPCSPLENILNYTYSVDYSQNYSSCYINCLLKSGKYNQIQENYTEISIFENSSLVTKYNLEMDNVTICNFSIDNKYIITNKLMNNSFDLSGADCCDVCVNNRKLDCTETRKTYLVIVYASLILVFYCAYNTACHFLAFVTISLATKSDSHFGVEYAFGMSGELAILIVVAFILETDTSSGFEINVDPIIWVAASIQFCAFLTLHFNTLPILPPGKRLMKKFGDLAKDVNILVFLLAIFVAGNGHAFKYTLHLLFLEEINTSSIVISLHLIVTVLCGFPVTLTSKWWLPKFKTNKLIILGLLSYAVNYAAYSFMVNPWWSLLIDTTEVFTNDLLYVTRVEHCHKVAPVGLAATLITLAGNVHLGIGRSSGVFFGGMLMNYVGSRKTYRIIAATFFTTAVLYFVFTLVRFKYLPVRTTENDTVEERNTDSKKADNA